MWKDKEWQNGLERYKKLSEDETWTLSIETNYAKWEKTHYHNYKKLLLGFFLELDWLSLPA